MRWDRLWTVLGAVAAAMALSMPSPARAASGVELFGPDNFILAGDLRLVAVDGEKSWVDGGFGKLRFGANEHEGIALRPALGSADLVWQPRLGWAVSATIVGSLQQQHGLKAGLSEAYVSVKPMGNGRIRLGARAGLMWPPVSLEHSGPEWAVRDTITPSAINSWIGEEVKVVGAEGTLAATLGGGKLSATAAIFDVDDTAGALIAYRGWALHDVKSFPGQRQPIPVLAREMMNYQPDYTHPLKEMDGGFLKRPGFYLRGTWQWAAPVRVEAIHYDNRSNPEAFNVYKEWGWRTKFDNLGATAMIAPRLELRAQAMRGDTVMGFVEDGHRLVETRFRSAFALLSWRLAEASSLAVRGEAFATRNRGSEVTSEDDEHGWAATIAGKHRLSERLTALVELLHVDSRRDARARAGLAPRQVQNQVQGAVRLRW